MRQESEQWKAQSDFNRAQIDVNRATIEIQRAQHEINVSLLKAAFALSVGQMALILWLGLRRWRCGRAARGDVA